MTEPDRAAFWVAILGPDGAGKSAVIKCLAADASLPFRAIQRFHFRPMFRRHCGESAPVTTPHGEPPRNALLSILKLLYWLADCWYGYVFVIRPSRRSSRLVLFDRYLDDILVDPLRYRLPNSVVWFARLIVRLAPHPDLYVLLDVPAEIVHQRKAEVLFSESHRQRLAYRETLERLPNAVLLDAALPVDHVTEQMKTVILGSLAVPHCGTARNANNRRLISTTEEAAEKVVSAAF